jgi:hypothetical protein
MQNQLYYILDIHASQTSMLGKWTSCIINLQVTKDIARRLQLYMYNVMGMRMLFVFTWMDLLLMRFLRRPESQQVSQTPES